MILPTKGVTPDRALLTLGGEVLAVLGTPATVSGLWERFVEAQNKSGDSQDDAVTFEWFALVLAWLYATNAITVQRGLLRRSGVSA